MGADAFSFLSSLKQDISNYVNEIQRFAHILKNGLIIAVTAAVEYAKLIWGEQKESLKAVYARCSRIVLLV